MLLLQTLQVPNLDKYRVLTDGANFALLVATHCKELPNFAIIMEIQVDSRPDPGIQLAYLDPLLVIALHFKRLVSDITTLGTLSPLYMYPKPL